jgi:hypothetical protein
MQVARKERASALEALEGQITASPNGESQFKVERLA